MNNKNRKELKIALAKITEALEIVESIRDLEQEKFDNLAEGLQQSENGSRLEENFSSLEEAANYLDDAKCSIETAIE